MRIRLLVLAASTALPIAGTTSTATPTKLLGGIGPLHGTNKSTTAPASLARKIEPS